MPVWKQSVQREKEAELIFRAGQYARAVALYQRKYANAFPPSVDVLLREKFLRKKYKDPMTNGDFRILSPLELQAHAGHDHDHAGLADRPGAARSGSSTSPGGTHVRHAHRGRTRLPARSGGHARRPHGGPTRSDPTGRPPGRRRASRQW